MRPHQASALASAAAHALVIGALVLTAHPAAPRAAPPKVLLQAAILPGKPAPRPTPAPARPKPRPAPARHAAARPAPRRPILPEPQPQRVLTSAGAAATPRELAQAEPVRPATAPPPSAQQASGRPAAGRSLAGGSGAGNYFGRIIARLERVKRYPDAERRRGREGTVLVRFVLARGGGVLDCRIEKGSGTAALDAEVLRMVRTAAPFPPLPETLKRDSLVLLVPVTFSLRQQG